jgi:hypothetical protein
MLILRDGTLFTAAGYYGMDLPWIGLPPDKLTDVKRFLFFDEALDSLDVLAENTSVRRAWVVAWQGDIMDPQNLVTGIFEVLGDPVPLPWGFGDVGVATAPSPIRSGNGSRNWAAARCTGRSHL